MLNKDLWESSLMYIAEGLSFFDKVVADFTELYKTEKLRFYNKAKQYALYNDKYITSGTLKRETNIRRILGVIICAEEDQELRQKISIILANRCFDIYKLVKSKSNDIENCIKGKMSNSQSLFESNSYIAVAYYVIRLEFGMEFQADECYLKLIKAFEDSAIERNNYYSELSDMLQKFSSQIGQYNKRILNNYGEIKNIKNLLDRMDDRESILFMNEKEFEKEVDIIQLTAFATYLFDYDGMAIYYLLENLQLSKQDINEILSCYSAAHERVSDNDDNKKLIMFYCFGIILKSLVKEYKKAKDFYSLNNSETQFIELDSLTHQVNDLTKQKEILNSELGRLKQENKEWENKLRSEVNNLNTAHRKEVKELNKQIDALKEQLSEERKKNFEINELREFAFSIKTDYVPRETEKSLEDLIKDKKIVVIGGHENWRKRLKEEYPVLIVLDGYNDTFDISVFNKAEFVFLYTGYMSHSVYYKVMNVIRINNIPYGFIGKTNSELLEKEMAEALY